MKYMEMNDWQKPVIFFAFLLDKNRRCVIDFDNKSANNTLLWLA